jgi:hypothetical protein
MKVCTKCDTERESDEFSLDRGAKDGKSSWCKPCTQESTTVHQKTDKDGSATKPKVYFILCAGLVKIGLSTRNVKTLIARYTSCTPYPIKVIHIEEFDSTEDMREAESMYHDIFDWRLSHGEWFHFEENYASNWNTVFGKEPLLPHPFDSWPIHDDSDTLINQQLLTDELFQCELEL